MRKKLGIIALLLSLSCLMTCLAGCGGTETDTSQTSAGTTASTAPSVAASAAPSAASSAAADSAVSAEEASAGETNAVKIDYPIAGDYSFDVLYSKPTILDSTIMSGQDFDSSMSWDAMVEATGVTLTWQSVSEQAWDTQISLILAAGDYPDACNSNIDYTTGKTGLVDDDIMLDLSGYVQKDMPNYDAILTDDTDFAKCVYESNGMLVQIQSRASTFINSGLSIRQDWLEELGMDTPTTLDELTDYLTACKNKYGLTNAFEVTSDLNIGLNRSFNVKCEGDRMQYQLDSENGDTIVWSGATQNFRDYIEFLRGYYEKGLFNDDYLNISNQNGNVQSTFLAGNTAAWNFDCSAMVSGTVDGQPIADLKLKDDDTTNVSGITDVSKTGSTGAMMVFSSCAHPDIFCQFLDYFFSPEGTLLANWGLEGKTYTLDENGDPSYTDLVLNDKDCFMFLLRSARYALYWAPSDFDVNLMIADYTKEQKEAVDMWVATRDSYLCYPPNFHLSDADQATVDSYEADCSTYFWENTYKVIVGQETMDDFDNIVKTAQDMGMTQVVDAYNNSYSAYLKDNA